MPRSPRSGKANQVHRQLIGRASTENEMGELSREMSTRLRPSGLRRRRNDGRRDRYRRRGRLPRRSASTQRPKVSTAHAPRRTGSSASPSRARQDDRRGQGRHHGAASRRPPTWGTSPPATSSSRRSSRNSRSRRRSSASSTRICPEHAIFASNTSTPVNYRDRVGLRDVQDRLVGMHFCLPAQLMKLIEMSPRERRTRRSRQPGHGPSWPARFL